MTPAETLAAARKALAEYDDMVRQHDAARDWRERDRLWDRCENADARSVSHLRAALAEVDLLRGLLALIAEALSTEEQTQGVNWAAGVAFSAAVGGPSVEVEMAVGALERACRATGRPS